MRLSLRRFAMADIAAVMSWFEHVEAVLQWADASMPYPLTTRALKAIERAAPR